MTTAELKDWFDSVYGPMTEEQIRLALSKEHIAYNTPNLPLSVKLTHIQNIQHYNRRLSVYK